MKEFAMALWAMTATHHEWPKPNETTAIVEPSRYQTPKLNDEERAQLEAVLKRMAKCASGKLVFDPISHFYVPEQRAECR
jgi:hypothetical protein